MLDKHRRQESEVQMAMKKPKPDTEHQDKVIRDYKDDMALSGRLGESRRKYREEKEFVFLDHQWEEPARSLRESQSRPVVTINTSRQYIQRVSNGVRQNPPGINIIPIGDGADVTEAQIREEIIRGIQRDSAAAEAYVHGIEDACAGGYGVVMLEPEYEADDSFNQKLRLRAIHDAGNVYLDPRARPPYFKDQRFFIEHVPYSSNQLDSLVKGDASAKEVRDFIADLNKTDKATWGISGDGKTLSLINYWKVDYKLDTLYQMEDGTGAWAADMESMDGVKMEDGKPVSRQSYRKTVWWRRMLANRLLSEVKWCGSSIPAGICVGQFVVVDDVVDFVSMTRGLMDTQRIRNFARSNQVELMAAAPKSRIKASLESIPEELRPMWENAHTQDYRVLYYQERDEQGRELTEPSTMPPDGPSTQLSEEVNIVDGEMHQVTGTYEESLGENSNADSGKAIALKKQSGQNATFQYEHNGSVCLEYLGDCIMEVMPYYYDSERQVLAIGSDGTKRMVSINKPGKDAKGKDTDYKITKNAFKCTVQIGPNYATKMLQALDQVRDILQTMPSAGQARPDLVMKIMGDATGFPMTQEFVESMAALIPPIVQQHLDQIKQAESGQQPIPPQVQQQLQQQGQHLQEMAQIIQHLTQAVNDVSEKNAQAWAKIQNDATGKETDRMAAIGKIHSDAAEIETEASTEIEGEHIQAASEHAKTMAGLHGQQMQQQAQPEEPELQPNQGA